MISRTQPSPSTAADPKAMRDVLIKLGAKRLGKPDRKTIAVVSAIDEYERLERLIERVSDAGNWKELLR